MPDLLGATNPVPGYEKGINNRPGPISADHQNQQVQNVPDPNRVNRADRQTERQDNNLQGDGKIRYDSNLQTFLQRLRETPDMAQTLTQLFAGREGLVVLSGMQDGVAAEMAQLLSMLQMDEKQLTQFLSGQLKAGTQFGGALFAFLRSAYAKASSEGVRNDILQFLKSYSDYASTPHLESSMLRNLRAMADAMPASWGEKLREIIAQLENGIAAGDRKGNLALLHREVFPFMSEYVEKTHDMGTPRELLTLLTLNTARYENGAEEKLLETFHQLSGYGTLKNQLGAIDDQSLLKLLKNAQVRSNSAVAEFTEQLTSSASKALKGEGSAEVQQGFRNLIAAMLLNESVYMPINHFMLPIEWDGRLMFSELWVDPDAEDGTEGKGESGKPGEVMRFLFKMDIQPLGLFDVLLTSRKQSVELQIACPEEVASFSGQIEQDLANILVKNELTPSRVTVRKMNRPLTLTEVFPKIFEGKNGINVKI